MILRELLYGNRHEDDDDAIQDIVEDAQVRDTGGDFSRARAMALKDWKSLAMGAYFIAIIVIIPFFICA